MSAHSSLSRKEMERTASFILVAVCLACAGYCAPLQVEDFDFGPPLGSEGATIEKTGENQFLVTLSHAPEHPGWANHLQFRILRNAKGNPLKMTVRFVGETQYSFVSNFHSWSYDGVNWQPTPFASTKTETDPSTGQKVRTAQLEFSAFEKDTVWFGFQVPMTYEQMVEMVERWKRHPAVTVHEIGRSLEGRKLIRLEIADPDSPYPKERRWVHYFANQHPGEYNSMWRMVGMIEFLLSDEGKDARQRSICHFVLMQSPDGPGHGWHRTNRQGIDMNRSYAVAGAFPEQGHEPYLFQKDLEGIMASSCPVTTVWSMHTWPGAADPTIAVSPADIAALGPPEKCVELLKKFDPDHKLVKPLKIDSRALRWRTRPWTPADSKPDGKSGGTWDGGPRAQFGVTACLCEGGADLLTKEENIASGRVLIQALTQYYEGIKPAAQAAEKTSAETVPRPAGS